MGEAADAAEPVWRRGEERIIPDAASPQITPAPSVPVHDLFLAVRQDDGQIQALSNQLQQLSAASRSVSQASQQVSQSSQQLSQSLQQATQQLSQTQQSLASARAGQSAAEAASRAATQAAQDASRSAQDAVRSASSSASAFMASVTGSMGASFKSAVAQASQSAALAMNSAASVVQKAQADATAVRNEANTQVQQAQGAALSVTQTALAVVGGVIGSSLLTVAAFVLVLRYRRRRRRAGAYRGGSAAGSRANIGYPALTGTSNKAALGNGVAYNQADYAESSYSTDDDYPADIKAPLPALVPGRALSRKKSTATEKNNNNDDAAVSTMGLAVSYYTPMTATPPPQMATMVTVKNGLNANNVNGGGFQLGDPPPPRGANTKFTLFPKASSDTSSISSPQMQALALAGNYSPMSDAAGPSRGAQRASSRGAAAFPSLDTWLRAGTVSPFATLRRGQGQSSPDAGRR